MPTLASLIVRLSADTRDFENKMRKSQTGLGRFSRGLSAFGANARALGGTLSTFVTAPVVGLGLMASKGAMEFESSFAGVRKTVDATDKEFAEMEKQFRALSKQIPVNVNDLNKYGEAAGQLGIEKDNIVSFTRVIADLGVTTNLTGEEGAQALARFANIIGMSQKDFDRLGSTIVDLGNKGASTEQEIMAMGLRLAGAGKVIGLTEAQTLGFANALSSVGIEAEAGGSAFSKVFIELASAGGAKLEKLAKVAGMSGAAFKKAFKEDAAGATISFVEGLGNIQKSGGDLFGVLEDLGITEVRMRDALLRSAGAGDLMRQSIEDGTKAWRDNNALTEEAKKRYETFESKLQIFKNRINDVGISVGQKLLPHLTKFAGTIADLAERFGRLNPRMQENIIKWAGIAALVGPALMVLGTMASAISNLINLFSQMKIAMTFLATNPYALIIGGIALATWALYRAASGVGGPLRSMAALQDDVARATRSVKQAEDDLDTARLARRDAQLQYKLALNEQKKANEEVAAATRAKDEAEATFGANSPQYQAATDQLKEANLRLEGANIRADATSQNLKKSIEKEKDEKHRLAQKTTEAQLAQHILAQETLAAGPPVDNMTRLVNGLKDAYDGLKNAIWGAYNWLKNLIGLGPPPAPSRFPLGGRGAELSSRQHGGWAPHGIYELGEKGKEYVLTAAEAGMAKKSGLYLGPTAGAKASSTVRLENAQITGTFRIDGDGLARLIDGRISADLAYAADMHRWIK